MIQGGPGVSWCMSLNHAKYIIITSLYFKSLYTYQLGLICQNNCTNLRIINNTAVSNYYDGFKLAYPESGNVAFSVISNNICNYNNLGNHTSPAGITIYDGYSNKVIYNQCSHNGNMRFTGTGIRIQSNCFYNSIISNICVSNGNNGIDLTANIYGAGQYNQILKNICSFNSNDGIRLVDQWQSYNVFNNNITANNFHNGIENEGHSNNFSRNMCFNNQGDGIQLLQGCNGNNINYNSCYYNANDGIDIEFSTNNILLYNTIYKNNYTGIYVLTSPDSCIYRNIVYSNINAGIYLKINANNCHISTNIVRSTTAGDGIKIEASSLNTIISNNSYRNQGTGISLILAPVTNSYICRNNCWSNANGFWVQNAIDNSLILNNSYQNTNNGIFISDAKDNSIISNNLYYDDDGVFLQFSTNNKVYLNNSVRNSEGIHVLNKSIQNRIIKNNVLTNYGDGILFNQVNNNYCGSNICIFNNYGIRLTNSTFSTVQRNAVYRNINHGILLIANANNNLIINNTVVSNDSGGGADNIRLDRDPDRPPLPRADGSPVHLLDGAGDRHPPLSRPAFEPAQPPRPARGRLCGPGAVGRARHNHRGAPRARVYDPEIRGKDRGIGPRRINLKTAGTYMEGRTSGRSMTL